MVTANWPIRVHITLKGEVDLLAPCQCKSTTIAMIQVKAKYGEERYYTLLIKDISFAMLMQEIKKNFLSLTHLPASNICV